VENAPKSRLSRDNRNNGGNMKENRHRRSQQNWKNKVEIQEQTKDITGNRENNQNTMKHKDLRKIG
jgi:hypothetical protein